ncbi:MAG: competence protein TfoX [Sphingobium sp.]|nr:MAG: competence protein TfoX [Sphingobium sp.]
MSVDQGLIDWVGEALEPMGRVTMRRMMGGATLYLDGTVFAIVDSDARGGELWFKADKDSDTAWDAAERPRFTYDRDGQTATMNYRNAPPDVYDDPDAMRHWAGLALEAGLRAARKGRESKG